MPIHAIAILCESVPMNLSLYRDEFEPPRPGFVYLNHAGVSPLPRRCAEAMRRIVEGNRVLSPESYGHAMARLKECREAVARMLNVTPDEIALSRNTTEGINWVANGLPWKPGDRVVSINREYPANIYPWMRLKNRGVELHLIDPVDERVSLEAISQALTPSTRLLTLSFVEFASGFRFDLEAVGNLCRERGVLFLVDLIQGMGVFPLDLKRCRVDFAAGGGQKWLLGPQGAGFFYYARERLETLEVTCAGASSVVRWTPYTDYDYTLPEQAKRFEYGTPATLPLAGMGISVNLLLEAGMENVRDRIRLLTDILVDGLTHKGYRCHSPRGEGEWSGIVSFTHPARPSASVVNELLGRDIWAVEREGRIRLTPHFYQTDGEMKRVVECM